MTALRAGAGMVLGLLPGRSDYAGLRRSWPRDLAAGVTVGIVALPLALAFGVATGVGAGPGLITAVIAGAVAAVFGGSNVQVSGPTGAMTVVLIPLVAHYGPEVVYPLAVMAGVIIVAAALLRLGRLLAYIPWPLIEGFTAGIAVVIAAQQIPAALGVDKPGQENAAAAAAVAIRHWAAQPNWAVLGLLGLSIALTAGLPRLHRSIPASIVAIAAVTGAAALFHVAVDRIGALPSGLNAPAIPDLGDAAALAGPALTVAFLASLESLLSAQVADGMSGGGRHNPDRELFGQGLANIAAGLGGGMPATGALARTAVNARAGARTRVAALTHALVLAAIVYLAAGAVGRIPLVALAGVLLVTAYRMVDLVNVRSVLRSTAGDAAVFAITAGCTIALDLVRAVAIGLILSAVLALRSLSATATATPEPIAPDDDGEDGDHRLLESHILVYRLSGPLFFAAAARFLDQLTAIADVQAVILRLGPMTLLDASGARALHDITEHLEKRHITVLIKCTDQRHLRILASAPALKALAERGHLFDDLPQSIAHARRHVVDSQVPPAEMSPPGGAECAVPAR